MKTLHSAVCGLLLASLASHSAWADVFNMPSGQKNVEFVTVGDPGNVDDVNYGYCAYGAVPYVYQIGKYDVTVAQYCRFLNAVARVDDPYGLYNPDMAAEGMGCGIRRDGGPGNYTYAITRDPNFPVNCVSWADAARFCNWLSNSQQGVGTTETGSYMLNGATNEAILAGVSRSEGARYVIPNENEWYKAAYYKGGSTNAGYWLYSTQSNDIPSNALSSAGTNNVNYWYNGYADPTNYLTPVGYFAGSPGPYGTFDQGGNVFQWNETSFSGAYRGLRGGSFSLYIGASSLNLLKASSDGCTLPTNETFDKGFRIALVPEPATLSLLALGGLLLARRRRV